MTLSPCKRPAENLIVQKEITYIRQLDEMTRAQDVLAEVIGIDSRIDTIQRVLVMVRILAKSVSDLVMCIFPGCASTECACPRSCWVPVYYPGARRSAGRSNFAMRCNICWSPPGSDRAATTASDIECIVRSGEISAFLTIEGGRLIADDLQGLRTYHMLGMRSMGAPDETMG